MPNFPLQIINIACGLVCVFFAILFLQSGVDKVTDWKGNLDWLTGHFSKSPLKSLVPVLLGVLTLAELGTGILSAYGALKGFPGDRAWPSIAMIASCSTLLMLFFGQRVAKDYPGAATIAGYFGVALLGLYLTSIG